MSKQQNKSPSDEQIDEFVVQQTDDDAAWEEPICVKQSGATKISISLALKKSLPNRQRFYDRKMQGRKISYFSALHFSVIVMIPAYQDSGNAMQTDRIKFNYQREDDILYVTFGQEGRKGMGFNIHQNILLRFDRFSGEPLGLTFIDYAKLKSLDSIPLADFSKLPDGLQKTVRSTLLSEPVNRFVEIDPQDFASFSVVNPSMEKVLAA